MSRVLVLVASMLWAVSTSPAISQDEVDTLYGIDFTQTYSGEKMEIDTRSVDGALITLHRISPGLGGNSYLVETESGDICEFVTVFPLDEGVSTEAAFAILDEMRIASEDLYGSPSEVSGAAGAESSHYTWLSGHEGEKLPEGVATMDLALGWLAERPVAIFLKANHHRCKDISGMDLP